MPLSHSQKTALHAQRLADYARKPLRRLVQIDCHLGVGPGDSFMHPDNDGDVLMAGNHWDLCNTPDVVRVQFPDGTDRLTVIRALSKLLGWAARGDLWKSVLYDELPEELVDLERFDPTPPTVGESTDPIEAPDRPDFYLTLPLTEARHN